MLKYHASRWNLTEDIAIGAVIGVAQGEPIISLIAAQTRRAEDEQ